MNFGVLSFLNPLFLLGFLLLPLIWFLLRVTPPAPRLVTLPTASFLAGLEPKRQTSARTPWWLLLLRIAMAALLLIAASEPVLHPGTALDSRGDIRIVIDNGWDSAQLWEKQTRAALDLVRAAERAEKSVYLATTAPDRATHGPLVSGPLSPQQAQSQIRGLRPLPWAADYAALAALIGDAPLDTVWLSTGLYGKGFEDLVKTLDRVGALTLVRPAPHELPVLLRLANDPGLSFRATILTPVNIAGMGELSVAVMATDGTILDVHEQTGDPASLYRGNVVFDLPPELQNRAASFKIRERGGAGTVALLDSRSQHRKIGIVASENADSVLLSDGVYYIRKALDPYATILTGDVRTMLREKPDMIILPDIGGMPVSTLESLQDWMDKGGMILRFAGPNMTESEPFLTPVPVRTGGRALEGALTWDQPRSLAPFPPDSPFRDLDVTENISVKRQILAEPGPETAARTWAALTDGTPLITADRQGAGLLVLVHTTASPEWSNLALSGVYVQILRRMALMAGQSAPSASTQEQADNLLHAELLLDGSGVLKPAPPDTLPVRGSVFRNGQPGPDFPPGLYGSGSLQMAANIGDRITAPVDAAPYLPAGINVAPYRAQGEVSLTAPLLKTFLYLLALDSVLTLLLTGLPFITRFRLFRVAACLLILAGSSLPAAAQDFDVAHADSLYLAYVKTGNDLVDRTSERGLEALAQMLRLRTSAAAAGAAGVDPETDDLELYPLLYWPVDSAARLPSDAALQKLQSFMDHGGMIVFDTRDRPEHIDTLPGMAGTPNERWVAALLGSLDIAAMAPLPADHVLARSFYLIDRYPGRYDGGLIWVEEPSAAEKTQIVSSVLIGSHDWASLWAENYTGAPDMMFRPLPRQQELSFRFGINLVMYALTGTYKADQVHLPQILERLGE